jgi:hypothetical protein
MNDSEVWTLSHRAANKIDSFERKIPRRLFGPSQSKGVWRIRYNDEIYKMYKDVALSTYIRLKRPCCKNGKTSYPKEGTRKLFWRRKVSGETTK